MIGKPLRCAILVLVMAITAGCATQKSQNADYDGREADCPECEQKLPEPAPYASPAPDPAAAAVQGLGYSGPMPLRSAARIMRVWVAPWESMDGVLHLAGYLYAEVEERRWSIGEKKMEVAPHITPLADRELPGPPDRKAQPQRPAARKPSQSPFKMDVDKMKKDAKKPFFDRKTGEVKKENLFHQMNQN
jgi:hypothetical protein